MKTKLLTISAILLLSTMAMQAQIGFGLLGGVNFQNINGKESNGDKLENGLLTGFHAGVNVNIPVAPDFYFQPGLLFSVKGAKNDFFNMPTKASGDLIPPQSISYIEIPLNLLYRPQVGNGYILLGFGPYFAFGIGGNRSLKAELYLMNKKLLSKLRSQRASFLIWRMPITGGLMQVQIFSSDMKYRWEYSCS